MAEFLPIRSVLELDALDDAAVLAGYFAGLRGEPEPSPHLVGRSWLHGWRNGAVDGGFRAKDANQALLAHLVLLEQACSDRVSGLSEPGFHFPIQ